MSDDISRQLEALVRRVFRELAPISDADLCPIGFETASSANESLEDLRHCSRYGLVEQRPWVDFDVLYRMTPYAVWYFAPSFMLMVLKGIEEFEFGELMQAFKFPDHFLADAGWDEFGGKPAKPESLDIGSQIRNMDVLQCLAFPSTHYLGAEWFVRHAAFYSPVEKKVVALFLEWLAEQWPGDPTIALALEHFWTR